MPAEVQTMGEAPGALGTRERLPRARARPSERGLCAGANGSVADLRQHPAEVRNEAAFLFGEGLPPAVQGAERGSEILHVGRGLQAWGRVASDTSVADLFV